MPCVVVVVLEFCVRAGGYGCVEGPVHAIGAHINPQTTQTRAHAVQAMPYWIDDPSLRESIVASGSKKILEDEAGTVSTRGYLLLLVLWFVGLFKPQI